MQNRKGRIDHPSEPSAEPPAEERRRIARVSHDERGNARVEWSRAPGHLERVPLSLEEDAKRPNRERGYDPYENAARAAPNRAGSSERDRRPKRDLRRLSEWIKHMRELEDRKRRGDGDESD